MSAEFLFTSNDTRVVLLTRGQERKKRRREICSFVRSFVRDDLTMNETFAMYETLLEKIVIEVLLFAIVEHRSTVNEASQRSSKHTVRSSSDLSLFAVTSWRIIDYWCRNIGNISSDHLQIHSGSTERRVHST